MDYHDNKQVRKAVIKLFRSVERDTSKLVDFLKESDYFEAPSSSRFHGAFKGGLAAHSLAVYNIALALSETGYYGTGLHDSLKVCCLCHDLCKIGVYQLGGEPCTEKQLHFLTKLISKADSSTYELLDKSGFTDSDYKFSKTVASKLIDWLNSGANGDIPEITDEWSFDDPLPLGHGSKSLLITSQYLELTDEEKLTINWHMGPFDLPSYKGLESFGKALKISRLPLLLFSADMAATHTLGI